MHEKGPAERRGREKGEVLEANRELELLQEELLRDRAGGAGERGDSDGDENLATWLVDLRTSTPLCAINPSRMMNKSFFNIFFGATC